MSEPQPPSLSQRKRPAQGWLGWKVWMRSMHLYLSLVGLVFALFFAATGFLLNHGEWFGADAKQQVRQEGQLNAGLEPLDRLAVVEGLRNQFAITAPLVEFQAEPEELFLRFARPGEDIDVLVVLPDGAVEVERERAGLLGVLTDLHKGERSGTLGGLLVDAAALLLLLFSLTGFALWLSLPKRRATGLWALGLTLGLVAATVGYLLAG